MTLRSSYKGLLVGTAMTVPVALAAPVQAQDQTASCAELTVLLEEQDVAAQNISEEEIQKVIDANVEAHCEEKLAQVEEQMQRAEGQQQQGQAEQQQAEGETELELTAEGAAEDAEQTAENVAAEAEQTAEQAEQTAEQAAAEAEQTAEQSAEEVAQTTEQAADEVAQTAEQAAETAEQAAENVAAELDQEIAAMTAGDLAEQDVYNATTGDEIGELQRIVRMDGQLYAVIAGGGFLGIGAEEVAVELNRLRVGTNGNLMVEGLTEEQLETAANADLTNAEDVPADTSIENAM